MNRRSQLVLPPGHLVGKAAAMRRVYDQLSRFAPMPDPVFLLGETGVGKEHLVKALHLSSPRARGPFLAVNCAAIPAELLEAEMFGIERGSATGVNARIGRFEQARGGTLFFDEVADLAPHLQAKLLRAIEEQEVQVVGGAVRKVDVRVVSASHRNLLTEARNGRFRSDLYFRVAGHTVMVPPLRERRGDIPALVRAFLQKACRSIGRSVPAITPAALDELVRSAWPGNVRQLDHAVRRLLVFCDEGCAIDVEQVRDHAALDQELLVPAEPTTLDLKARVGQLEAQLIGEALRRSGGHQIRAAQLLNIHRNTLTAKIRRITAAT